jgi:hypothetical protein
MLPFEECPMIRKLVSKKELKEYLLSYYFPSSVKTGSQSGPGGRSASFWVR